MDLPHPPQAIAALTAFVRDRLAGVAGSVSPVLGRSVGPADVAARQLATVIVGAAAPFAPTSYARARLIRQLHAGGLLGADDADRTRQLLALVSDESGSA